MINFNDQYFDIEENEDSEEDETETTFIPPNDDEPINTDSAGSR